MVKVVAILSRKRSVIWMLYCLNYFASYVDPYYSLLYQLLRISNFWNIIEHLKLNLFIRVKSLV